MPRIPTSLLDAVVYLYRTEEAAREGRAEGGTGFLVEVEGDPPFIYAVTNAHVVKEPGYASVIRINTKQGKTDTLSIDPAAWVSHPDGDDIAVTLVGLQPAVHRYSPISAAMCLRNWSEDSDIFGPGNETFFLGRFVTHEGRERNLPTIRFGNIAMMPWERVRTQRGIDQEAFLVESRSLSGYSGSPVFVTPYGFFSDKADGLAWTFYMGMTMWLLGIDCGHLPDRLPVLESTGERVSDGYFVKGNSGMMVVVPSWKLLELLEVGEVAEMRKKQTEEWKEKSKDHAVLDVAEGDAVSREQFLRDLRKVAKRRPQERPARSDQGTH
jgi:hypothetical protein